MHTLIWSLDESNRIVDRLCWNQIPEMDDGETIDSRLLGVFDEIIIQAFRGDGLDPKALLDLPRVARDRLIRHPYIAGFLSGRIQLNGREVLGYVIDSLTGLSGAPPLEHKLGSSIQLCEPGTTLSRGIVVDHLNNIEMPRLDDGREWLSNYEDAALSLVVKEMKGALHSLSQISPSAWVFVNCYIWNLSIRKNIEKPGRFGTFTFPTLPGLLMVCNPHSDTVDRFLLEESFVHEAIHCFVDWAEAQGPEILRARESNSSFVVSPWTGNPLNMHTAFHATLVWFGLGEYFKKCLEFGLSDAHASRFNRRLEFVRKGFRSKNFELLMEPLVTACNAGPAQILRVIASRREEVTDVSRYMSQDTGKVGV